MENYLSIFQGILSTENSFLQIYLDGLEELQKFSVQSESTELVHQITSLLTKSTTRALGLRLLTKFIEQCTAEIIEKKGNLWTTLVLKACNSDEFQCNASLIFEVLNKIIKSQQSPDLVKFFVSTHLCKVYECLINVPSHKIKYALICVETCLRKYPASSSPSRGLIERFLWKQMNHLDANVVQNCGKCLHLLQQVKAGGMQGINYKMQWKQYQIQLLCGIHSVYNEMFVNCIEMYDDKIEQEDLQWVKEKFEFDPDPVKKAAQMYTRCHNLLKFLIIALREPYPVEKPILVKKILNVLNRGMSVNCVMMEQNPISENIALSILLPKLHIDLLELLRALILILRGHLRSYTNVILSLVEGELKWTSAKTKHGEQKALLILRRKLYETVILWCKISHSGSRCDNIAEYLFQEILYDITPIQNQFTLQVLCGARKQMSKKARHMLRNAQNDTVSANSGDNSIRKENFSGERNQELCVSALRCLQEIFLSVANLIKPTLLKLMQTSITKICAILYEVPSKNLDLYSNRNCREEIYNTLYVMIMTPHHLCPPPSEIFLTIIQDASLHDDSLKVRIRCDYILQNLEKLIHPQKESLLFGIEDRDTRNVFIKMNQESLMHESVLNFSNVLNSTYENEDIENNQMHENTHNLPDISLNNHEIIGVDKQDDNTQRTRNLIPEVIERAEEHNTVMTVIKSNKVMNDRSINEGAQDTPLMSINTYVENSAKSPEFVLRVDDEDATTIDAEILNNDLSIDEPILKKSKIENEGEGSSVIENDENCIASRAFNAVVNEDILLADIASEFVDELD